jgi:hypothetical protein
MMTRSFLGLAAALPLLAALATPSLASPMTIGTVSADYDVTSGDNTTLTFTNTTGTPITNVVLSGLGVGGSINGATGTQTIGTIAGMSSVPFSFSAGSGVFANDPDDHIGGGTVQYTLTGQFNGQPITLDVSPFSPATNATGGFVAFLGNDSSGNESDGTVNPVVVAHINGVTNVPEPTSLALFGLTTFAGSAYYRWRRREQVVPA